VAPLGLHDCPATCALAVPPAPIISPAANIAAATFFIIVEFITCSMCITMSLDWFADIRGTCGMQPGSAYAGTGSQRFCPLSGIALRASDAVGEA
jgi:hypothetical protein